MLMIRTYQPIKYSCIILLLIIGLLTGVSNLAKGQAVGDYGSNGTGNWSNTSSWVVCTTANSWAGATTTNSLPTSTTNVWIRTGHTITENTTANCKNLTINGTLTWAKANTLNVGGSLTIGGGVLSGTRTGILNVAGTFSVPASATADIQRVTLTVTGTSTIAGTLGFSTNLNGVKTFKGLVTINSGGVWNNSSNEDIVFQGGLTNNGTLNAGTGIYSFTTNPQSIGGSGTLTIPNVTVTGVTLTNSNTLSITTNLTGTGTLLQASNAILNIGGTNSITTLTASAIGNTVNYNRAGIQTLKATPYYNLILSGTSAKTLPTGLTSITNDFTISGSATATTTAGLTIGRNLILSNTAIFTAAGFPLTVTGATNLQGGSLTVSSATGTKIFNGLATISSGATWNNTGSSAITFRGGITNNGTFTAGNGIQTFDTNSQALTGAFTIPYVTVSGITLTNNNAVSISAALAGSGSLTQATNATLNLGGASTIASLMATAAGNTVNYNGGTQNIHSNDYYHLILSGSGTKTLPAAPISIAGNFSTSGTAIAQAGAAITFGGVVTLGSGTSFNAGIYSYNVIGNWVNNGATFSASTSAFTFNGSVAQTIGGTSPTSFYDLIANNTTGITINQPVNAASLTLNSGKVTTTTTNILTITGTSPDDILGNFSSSYINGPLARTLPSGLVSGTYLFPVGKSAYNPLSLVEANVGTGGNIVVIAEVFDANSGGTAGVGISSLNTNRYWSASVTSGTAFTNTKIQVTETGLSVEDAIGESSSKTGAYARISNAPPSGNTITSDPVTALGYFVIGQKPILSIAAASDGTEGGSNGLFTITTSKQFTVDRTVNLIITGTAINGTDYTTINTAVTFPAYQSTLTIPVPVIDDASVESAETVIVTLTDGTGYAIGTPSSATVNILDNDIAGITVTPVNGLSTTEAGGAATFTVKLTSQPTANVTIGLSSSNVNEGTVSPVSLIFTTVNWNVPQTVTVAGVNDFVKDGNITYSIITAPATSIDNNYKNKDASDVSVSNQDDDVAGITVSPLSGLTTSEAGGTATFTMVLTSQPIADVSVALSSDDLTEGSVAPSPVTFTSANWNVAQTVTVTGANDFMVDGNILYHIVTAAATSTDPNYANYNAADVLVTNTDNDVAGVTVTPASGLVTNEAGGKATFTIVLNSQPSFDVLINITSDNINEGTITPGSVTFTSANWNTPQTITITGTDDSSDDGNKLYHILTSAAISSDINYSGLFPQTVSVTNDDNDVAGISVSPTSLTTTEAAGTGHSKTFTIVLNTLPTADVTIGITSANLNEGTVSPSSVTFSSSDWKIPKVITVTGVDDFVDDGDQVYTVITAPATGGDYAGLNAADITVTNQDDDVAGITVTPTNGLITTEAGATASFTINLNSQPTANVNIGFSSNDLTEGTISPASVTFTTADWNTPKTITVTGVNDYVQDGDIAFTILTSQASSTDPLYSVINPSDVSVINKDDDVAGYTITPTSGLITTEAGGAATLTIRLNSEPTANVTVGLTSSDTGEGTVSPSSVIFTPLNWNTNQTVTVTGADDFEMDGDILYTIVTTVNPGADLIYNAKDPADISITNKDNDVAGITVTPINGLVTTEAGGKATFTVKLSSQPIANVTIGLSSSNAGEGTVSPSSITFTVANWNTNQTVTVTGVNDFIQDGNITYSIITAPATSADLKYNNMDASDVSVSNTDDDVAGITVTPISGLITTESGGTDRFNVVLTSQPTADVTIGISSSKASEGTVSVASMTFTAANWNVSKSITITGVDDYSVDGDVTYTIVTAPAMSADPNYNNRNAADVSVINKDNDVAGITVSPTSGLTTGEDGGQATFTIMLNTIPTANVSIGLSSNNAAEGSVLPSTVTITPADWNKPVTVTITGTDDYVDDGDIAYSIITASAVSSDTKYNGLNPSDVSVTNINNDAAGITVNAASGLTTTEGGGTASFTVVLDSQPNANVTINFTSSNTAEGTVVSSVSFSASDWKTPKLVTITGKNDNSNDGDIAYVISSTVTSTDSKYNGISGDPVSVTNLDNDTPGALVTPVNGLITTEAGGTATFTIVLITQPSKDVTINLVSDTPAEGTVSPSSITFTGGNNGNWATPQTITVKGVNDDKTDGDVTYSIQSVAVSLDVDYDGMDIPDVSVTNKDLTPTITSFSPSSVCYGTGASIVITGTFLTTASSVKISGLNMSYTINSATQITATLPATATTGKMSITTGTGIAVSSNDLIVSAVSVGGSVSGGTTICAGSGSGTLTLNGQTGDVAKWQSSLNGTDWTDIPNTTTTYVSGALNQTTQFRAVVTSGACSSAYSSATTVTVRPTPTASISGTTTTCKNSTSPLITFSNPQSLPVTITYKIDNGSQTTINVNGGATATVSVPTAIAGTFNYNLVSVAYQENPSCSNNITGTAQITVVNPPTATAGTDMVTCSSQGAINITTGASAANYSTLLWTSSGTGTFTNNTSLTLATYQPSASDISLGFVTLTLTANANTPCSNAVSTKTLTISLDGNWTGAADYKWNNPANWACNQLPGLSTDVIIPSGRPNYPIVSEAEAMARNITIGSGASVTVTGNTLRIAGSISNNGTFTATSGTIEMTGASAQTIGAGVFASNTLMNLIINNPLGVTLQGALNITGYLRPFAGDFNAAGLLTLISTATQTALIEGTENGNVKGLINIQRYLPSSFGYKYFSSPFRSATVGVFANVVNLGETFPSFYKYDENNSTLVKGLVVYKSGWVKYVDPASALIPLAGYAANLGTNTAALTVSLSGEVNNGPLFLSVANHNREFTKGFNLVGNPYPSPIDWNASGWTKNNIDNAIYFFKAGNTDRYTGVYSSYVDGKSTDDASNVIAALQGFFVHVSDDPGDVTGTLGVTNAVRINNFNPAFKRAVIDNRPTLRLTAGFEIKDAIQDVALVYFDDMASEHFEKEKDALKIENTDEQVPNIYTLTSGSQKLSINGLAEPSDSLSFIPVGITTYKDGWIVIKAENVIKLPFTQVFLEDKVAGKNYDLSQLSSVRISLSPGVYDNRFRLVFSKGQYNAYNAARQKLFTLIRSENQVLVKVNLPEGTKGKLTVTNMLGQAIVSKEVSGMESVGIKQDVSTGVFVITLVSGRLSESEKIIMRTDYE